MQKLKLVQSLAVRQQDKQSYHIERNHTALLAKLVHFPTLKEQ
jgi:hypothetical protein